MSAKRQRGANFSNADDCQLGRWWLNVSQDATTGVGQKAQTFWECVETYFSENTDGDQAVRRSSRSLASKWSQIQHDVSKFVGAYAAIKDLNPSGAGEEDMIKRHWNCINHRILTRSRLILHIFMFGTRIYVRSRSSLLRKS